jgi:hypothetical protein
MRFSPWSVIRTIAFSSEVATGSRQENASNIETIAALRNFKQDFKRQQDAEVT